MRRVATLLREKMRMMREDASAVARVVEQAFQGGDAVEDDLLSPDVRQMFYDLQDADVLTVDRHEYTENGQLLRGYRWHLVDDKPVVEMTRREEPEETPEPSVYDQLEADAWERRNPHPAYN